MEVIMLEKVGKFNVGEVALVKNGFARFLFLRKKAIRATKGNLELVEKKRDELEKTNLARKAEAEAIAKKIDGLKLVLVSQAGDDGRLYGSVNARDIANAIKAKSKHDLSGDAINIPFKIKEIGVYSIEIRLHPDVSVFVSLNVARNENEMAEESTAAKESPVASKAAAKSSVKEPL